MDLTAFLLDELLGDDIVGAKEDGAALGEHWPADEQRAVICLVGNWRERGRRTDLYARKREAIRVRSKRGIGPVYLRHPSICLQLR